MPHPLKFPEIPEPPREPPPLRLQPPMVFVPPKWEYKHLLRQVTNEPPLSEEELDKLGAEGWELAAVFTGPASVHFYFKRSTR
jgi:hypothetical protein